MANIALAQECELYGRKSPGLFRANFVRSFGHLFNQPLAVGYVKQMGWVRVVWGKLR